MERVDNHPAARERRSARPFPAPTAVRAAATAARVAATGRGSWPAGLAARLAGAMLLCGMLALGGCATYLNAQVTSFHRPEQSLAGRRFVIEPTAEQAASLEFKAYAEQVRQALAARGLVDAAGGPADTTVKIRYTIDGGRSVGYTVPGAGYVPYGPSMALTPYRGRDGAVYYAWTPVYPFGYPALPPQYVQTTIYRRELRLEIATRGRESVPGPDAKQEGSPAVDGARLYEGTAVSEGESASLAPVMPALIQALFADFPGPDGGSRIVRVTLPPAR